MIKMGSRLNLEGDFGFFKSYRNENSIVMEVRNNFLQSTTDLDSRDLLLQYFDLISDCDSIKTILILDAPDKTGFNEYFDLFYHVYDSSLGISILHRMYNTISQIVLKIVELNKIVIHANSGKVITPFLNMSLSCDYRMIADNTLFQNPYLEMETLPIGGGAFFLSKMLGHGKTYAILLEGKDIPAEKALKQGIVNRVVSQKILKDEAIQVTRLLAQHPAIAISGIKKQTNYALKDLKNYLDFESGEFQKIIMQPDFWKKFGKKIKTYRQHLSNAA